MAQQGQRPPWSQLPIPVDVPSVTDTHDLNEQAFVDDVVHDPVVTDPDSIGGKFAGKLDAARQARRFCRQVDCRTNSNLIPLGGLNYRFGRPAGDPDLIAAHSSPSIAFTSSQGT